MTRTTTRTFLICSYYKLQIKKRYKFGGWMQRCVYKRTDILFEHHTSTYFVLVYLRDVSIIFNRCSIYRHIFVIIYYNIQICCCYMNHSYLPKILIPTARVAVIIFGVYFSTNN